MDRLPAQRLEVAHESVTEVGAAAVTNGVAPPLRQTRLSHRPPGQDGADRRRKQPFYTP